MNSLNGEITTVFSMALSNIVRGRPAFIPDVMSLLESQLPTWTSAITIEEIIHNIKYLGQ